MISEVDERDETTPRPQNPETFLNAERGITQVLERCIRQNDIETI